MTDPIARMAQFLAGHVSGLRHRQEADEFLNAVDACLRVVRGLARGPSEQKYLGPCGAPLIGVIASHDAEGSWDFDEVEGPPCDGDVYAYRGAKVGRCRTCGAEVATSEREAWLDAEVRAHAFPAKAIAEAHNLNVKTIRTWASRGLFETYWRTDAGLVIPWSKVAEESDAERLHYVGDVLDLAAADAARRETDRAKRARRRDTKTEEDAA